jgi:hypothetical protein
LGRDTAGLSAPFSRAVDDSVGVGHTPIGQGRIFTKQGAITEIAIFVNGAIFIDETITFQLKPSTLALRTDVGHSARVTVIAWFRIGGVLATALGGAEVVGTAIAIVTKDRFPHTVSVFAMVGSRAWVTVGAFTAFYGLVQAPRLWIAGVFCTRFAVVAAVFVDESITVVIDAVACLYRRCEGIAFSETFGGADALACAHSRCVFHAARRM